MKFIARGLTVTEARTAMARMIILEAARAIWRGRPLRVFIIVEGLFRNRTTLKGPDSTFKGLEPFITTGRRRRQDDHHNPHR